MTHREAAYWSMVIRRARSMSPQERAEVFRLAQAAPYASVGLGKVDAASILSAGATTLLDEAKPRIERLFAQYDRASPSIDWILDNWPLVVLGSFTMGVLASLVGQEIYRRLRR